jgi:hypothetical protein
MGTILPRYTIPNLPKAGMTSSASLPSKIQLHMFQLYFITNTPNELRSDAGSWNVTSKTIHTIYYNNHKSNKP